MKIKGKRSRKREFEEVWDKMIEEYWDDSKHAFLFTEFEMNIFEERVKRYITRTINSLKKEGGKE